LCSSTKFDSTHTTTSYLKNHLHNFNSDVDLCDKCYTWFRSKENKPCMRYVPLIDTNYNLFAKLTLEHEYSIKEHEGETFWVINEQIFKILY
jgi:hypothetical protein